MYIIREYDDGSGRTKLIVVWRDRDGNEISNLDLGVGAFDNLGQAKEWAGVQLEQKAGIAAGSYDVQAANTPAPGAEASPGGMPGFAGGGTVPVGWTPPSTVPVSYEPPVAWSNADYAVVPERTGNPSNDLAALVKALGLASGGGGGGGRGGAPSLPPPNPVDTPEEIDAYVRKTYGYMAGYLDHPEIGAILRQAAVEGWDINRLQGALSATNWWKSTTATAREWDALAQTDPASANEQVNRKQAEITDQASRLGLTISPERARIVAETVLREGWSPEMLTKHLFGEGGFNPEAPNRGGQIAAAADLVKELAGNYFLTISTRTANEYAQGIITGTMTQDGLETMFRDQAKGRFPSMADMIDRGVKPVQFFDSYQQQIASMLEIDADQVDLMSAKWMPVVDTVGSDGARRPMTLSEVADFVRKTPEWDFTDSALQQAARAGELLGQTFGKVG